MAERRSGLAGRIGGLSLAAAAAVATGLIVERKVVQERRQAAGDADRLGTLHSTPRQVVATDGVVLHAEVDEVAPYSDGTPDPDAPTLVFSHGFALNLDCWHFQRQALRGKYRMVFYDQRAHGQSQRGEWKHATIDQLGADLNSVIDQLVPQGRGVVVGHSMVGIRVMAYAEAFTRRFSDGVAGSVLIATSAWGMNPYETIGAWIRAGIGE